MFTLQSTTNVAVSEVVQNAGLTTIDCSGSLSGGIISGATSGIHKYQIRSAVNRPDVLQNETPLTLEAGNNVALVDGVWLKTLAGNSWNASVRGTERFSVDGTFAITWEIQNTTGTVRQMAGIGNVDPVRDSYSGLSHGVYQINNYFYEFVYESGTRKSIPDMDYGNRTVTPGHRFGVTVSAGQVEYFIMKGTSIFPITASTNKLSGDIYFQASFNRGDGESGQSSIANAFYHSGVKLGSAMVEITGNAADPISEEDVSLLADVGLIVSDSATYGILTYERSTSNAFTTGGVPYDVDVTHTYTSVQQQDLINISYP